jgi:periplasmic protein TonB
MMATDGEPGCTGGSVERTKGRADERFPRTRGANSVVERVRRERSLFVTGLLLSVAAHAAALSWMSLPPSDHDFSRSRAVVAPVQLAPLVAIEFREVEPEPAARPPSESRPLDDEPAIYRPEERVPETITAFTPVVDTPPNLAAPTLRRDSTERQSPTVQVPSASSHASRGQYEQQIARWVERYREYPLAARRRGLEGTAVVRLRLGADGTVLQALIVRDTGHALLDRAALGMIERAAPFPGIPSELGGSSVEVLVPIQFAVGR